jgi:hypothetical protein
VKPGRGVCWNQYRYEARRTLLQLCARGGGIRRPRTASGRVEELRTEEGMGTCGPRPKLAARERRDKTMRSPIRPDRTRRGVVAFHQPDEAEPRS